MVTSHPKSNAHPKELSSFFVQHQKRALVLRHEPVTLRKQKLKALKNWLFNHRTLIHEAVYKDLAKPASEVDLTEIYPMLTEARHAIRRLKLWTAPEPVEGSLTFLGTNAYVYYEPKGTSLIISPWNYPFLLSIGPMISSIAAGNTIVLKPSEFTPATNAVIGQMITDLFAKDEIVMIEGEADIASVLLEQPYDHIFFTGSPAVGKIVMTAAAKNLTSVTLELGGKSPTIVDETADVQDAARKITWGKWTNAGQTCVAPDYLLVHSSKKDELVEAISAHSKKMYSSKANYTSIINERHFQRLKNAYDDALSKKAVVDFGGDFDPKEKTLSPTLMTGVTDEMNLLQEEIFGPILPVMEFDDLQEVVNYINDRPKPLALYLYTRSNRNKKQILRQTSSGAVVFNDSVLQFGHPHLPMGGVNNSGIGKAHGKAGFQAFSHGKAVLRQRVGFTIVRSVYPPYNKWKKKAVELMLRYF